MRKKNHRHFRKPSGFWFAPMAFGRILLREADGRGTEPRDRCSVRNDEGRLAKLFLAESEIIANMGSWAVDSRNYILFRTRQTSRLLEVDGHAKMTLQDFWALLDPASSVQARMEFELAQKGREICSVYRLAHLAGGETRDVEWRARPARPGSTIIWGTLQDVTDRVRAEARLHHYAAVLDLSQSLARVGDVLIRNDGTVTLNRMATELLGFPKTESTIDHWVQCFRPNDRDAILDKIASTGQVQSSQLDVNIQTQNGGNRDLRLRFSGLPSHLRQWDDASIICVILDISHDAMSTRRLRSLTQTIFETCDEERFRLANELQDGVGQVLAAIRMRASHDEDNRVTAMADDAIASVRSLLSDILPVSLDAGLAVAAASLCKIYEHDFEQGIAITVDMLETAVVPLKTSREIVLVLRELLDIAKKRGDVARISIRIAKDEESAWLCYVDDRMTEDPLDADDHNLLEVNERIRALRGSTRMEITQAGVQYMFSIPLYERRRGDRGD